ncbi:MAG: transglutaminase domain-containing protein [Clostridia bacterium]|nr:transglutaminase domain-containing protein [Clostridia bacterium]
MLLVVFTFQAFAEGELDVSLEAEAFTEAPDAATIVLEPTHPGTQQDKCDVAEVDFSNTTDGYVMACYTGETSKRLKLRVAGPKTTYTYNLKVQEWTTFPLSDGNGSYQVTIYKNASGNKYATVMSTKFKVDLADEFAPFLRPNQYVDYSVSSETVDMGAQICEGIDLPLEKVAAVYDYVVSNFSYDYDKAATVKSGYLPVLDTVLAEKKGICFDYAAVMTAMLRSQGIPCKLVVGYAGSTYHAWISVWTEENGWIDGFVFFNGKTWKRMDPTFASSSNRSDDIMDFIENGSYTVKYLY